MASPRNPERSISPLAPGPPKRALQTRYSAERGHDEEQRRQQPAGAAPPEGRQADAPGPGPLFQQEGGDQEAGEDEEEVDAEIPTLRPADLEVVGDDADDRDAAQAVEGGQVPAGDGGGGGRRRGALVDQGGVGHARSRRHTAAGPPLGRSRRSAAPARKGGSSSAVRSRATSGLPAVTGRGRPAAARTGK